MSSEVDTARSEAHQNEEPRPLMLLINPVSGGGLAGDVARRVEGDPSIEVILLRPDGCSFNEHQQELLRNPNLRVVACGGDGTVNAAVSILNGVFGEGDVQNRPPLAVVPFGTGNDMSRSLGWGRGMTEQDVRRIRRRLDKIRASNHVEEADVWKLRIERTDIEDVKEYMMLNYFSVGVDAEVAYDFENCRKGCCKCCFCCRCMSLFCYGPVSIGNMCCKRHLRSYCTVDIDGFSSTGEVGGETQRLVLRRGEKTLSFVTIGSMYAGKNPWISDIPSAMNDRKFEVVTNGGVCALGCFQIGCNTSHARGQGTGARITMSEPCYCQVDGEGKCINGPCVITITRTGSYPLVFKE